MRWIAIFLSIVYAAPSFAATFTTGTASGYRWIFLSGNIDAHDDAIFLQRAEDAPDLFVFLQSPGGSVDSGLNIGEIIHKRGYKTVVPNNFDCASICGAIWLGGAKRYAGKDARIGFHAAFTEDKGIIEISPYANASLGIYYNKLGLSRTTLAYLLNAGPRDMTWLKPDDESAPDIKYFYDPHALVPSGGETEPVIAFSRPPPVYSLSPDEEAVASRLTQNFATRFQQTGMPGMAESIESCYAAALTNHRWESALYCSGLDVLVMVIENKTALAEHRNPASNYSQQAVLQRIEAFSTQFGSSVSDLRAQGTAIAFYAASHSDTTEDPLKTTQVSARVEPVRIGRSAQSPDVCLSMVTQINQLSTDFGGAFKSVFCGKR